MGTRTPPLTTCTITGQAIGVALRVVAIDYSNHSSVPVVGAGVSGEGVVYCNDEKQVTPTGFTLTNSSGWVDLFRGGAGVYYLNVTCPNSKLVYSLSVPVQPVTATYVTFNVSTGNVTTRFCPYNLHCPTA